MQKDSPFAPPAQSELLRQAELQERTMKIIKNCKRRQAEQEQEPGKHRLTDWTARRKQETKRLCYNTFWPPPQAWRHSFPQCGN
jgi:hypothetical protein